MTEAVSTLEPEPAPPASEDAPSPPEAPTPVQPVKGFPPLSRMIYAIAAAIIVLDQLVKHLMVFVYDLPLRSSVSLTSFFKLTMVWNRGVSFGLFRSPDGQEFIRWALALFSTAVAVGLAVWARKIEKPLVAVAVALVMGGAVGNLIDRVRWGAVADFLDFSGLYFPWVFNVADSAITVGVVLLLVDSLKASPKKA